MVDYLSSQPLELIYKSLLDVDYIGIVNYCSTSREARKICNDNVFWMMKLNHDFTIINRDGKMLIPSDYVKQYPHTDVTGQDIYKRWNEFDKTACELDGKTACQIEVLIVNLKKRNSDILMYHIEQGYKFSSKILSLLFAHIMSKSSVDTILSPAIKNLLVSIGTDPDWRIIKPSITCKRLDVLIRIEDPILSANNGYLGIEASNWTLLIRNIDALEFLYSKGYVPNAEGIKRWMSGCHSQYSIDALQWLEKRNMSITGYHLDDLIISHSHEQNIINILRWSYERGIVPTQEGIARAIHRNRLDIVQWLEEHKLL